MTAHVSKSEFKAKMTEYLRRVEESGEVLVSTDHGRPAFQVRRYSEPEPKIDPLDTLKGSVHFYDDPFEPVGLDDWEVLKP